MRVTLSWGALAKGLFSSLLSRLRDEIGGGGAMLEHQIKTVSLQMLSSDQEQVSSRTTPPHTLCAGPPMYLSHQYPQPVTCSSL